MQFQRTAIKFLETLNKEPDSDKRNEAVYYLREVVNSLFELRTDLKAATRNRQTIYRELRKTFNHWQIDSEVYLSEEYVEEFLSLETMTRYYLGYESYIICLKNDKLEKSFFKLKEGDIAYRDAVSSEISFKTGIRNYINSAKETVLRYENEYILRYAEQLV